MKIARGHKRIARSAEDLSEAAIAVIGLLNMGICENHRIGELLAGYSNASEPRRVMREFTQRVKDSTNDVVVSCIRNGLPAGLCASLSPLRSVYCRLCRSTINQVPCPRCSSLGGPALPLRNRQRPEPAAPAEPTGALPGTAEKMRIFAERLARGEGLFHPLDARL